MTISIETEATFCKKYISMYIYIHVRVVEDLILAN